MKKFIIKLLVLVLGGIWLPLCIRAYNNFKYDTFNVFHWDNIRFTSAEPNKNFVKTKYLLNSKKNFNAFVFGSSRVFSIPKNFLPEESDGTKLSWYDMTHSEGIPAEHIETLKTLSDAGFDIKMVLVAFDNIAMYATMEEHETQLLRIPYQVYAKNPLKFYSPYLDAKLSSTIKNQIKNYDYEKHAKDTEEFYNYGGCENGDYSINENPKMERFKSNHDGKEYTQKNAHEDIARIADFCAEKNIKFLLITNPLYHTTYKDAVECGYFDFLREVAKKCDFYNFSSLNNFTKDPKYYHESSHYRPILGLHMEKILFGTEEEKKAIRKEAGDELWGIKVTSGNIDFVIKKLQEQIDSEK